MKRGWMVVLAVVAAVGAVGAVGCSSTPGGANREVEVTVTDNGFEPNRIEVNKGDNVTLLVTRKTEQTCATEVVVAGRDIRQELPLNEQVRLAIGPVEGGEVGFACGMDMIKGTVVAQ